MSTEGLQGTLGMLADRDNAAEYLSEVLENSEAPAFALALRNVIEAQGGLPKVLREAGLDEASEEKIRSGQPISALPELASILRALGMRIAVESIDPTVE